MDNKHRQIEFLLELEKLKGVLRKTRPVGLERFENSAEHSWQTAMTALVLLSDDNSSLNALAILKMLLIHDIVEIDAGDVFAYDTAQRDAIAKVESDAAVRIFGLLPEELGDELLMLWNEFEAGKSPEARFAKAIDRVLPVLQNLAQDGHSWVENNISRQQVLAMNAPIANASPELWDILKARIDQASYLQDEADTL